MALFERIKKQAVSEWAKPQKHEPKTKADAGTIPQVPLDNLSFLPGIIGQTTASGVTVTERTVLQLSAAYTCINLITKDISGLPINVKKSDNGGWKNLENTPYLELLAFPNKRQTTLTMLQTLVFAYMVSGNGYVVIIRDKTGAAINLVPVDPWNVNIEEKNNGDRVYHVTERLLSDYRTSIKSEKGINRRIREEDMIHIQSINIVDTTRGNSPINLAGEVFGLGLAAQETAARAFNNGSYFQGYLKVQEGTKINSNKQDQLQENWNRSQQSVTNAGKIPVVPSGVDFVNTGASPVDLQLLEAREQITKDIARMYGVPLHKLGFGDSEKAANLSQQERSYVNGALSCITKQIEQQFNTKILFRSDFNKIKFEFDFNELVIPDMLERGQYYAIAITNGFMSKDEVRELEGYAPIPDGQGNTFLSPTYTAQQDGTGSHNIGEPKKDEE
ncbi:HK97 family phage portal protein [Gluconobacter cerinus]|uniref:phage portal protein n=1 Tax=Gluconobacter cerinus TaxID=38307 RepID=UPI0022269C03|nr:phage portal protein [Gluconobacter cerinus]MCW2267218.1 HK97 family phage portal protein [Gluconobacter cerinus]